MDEVKRTKVKVTWMPTWRENCAVACEEKQQDSPTVQTQTLSIRWIKSVTQVNWYSTTVLPGRQKQVKMLFHEVTEFLSVAQHLNQSQYLCYLCHLYYLSHLCHMCHLHLYHLYQLCYLYHVYHLCYLCHLCYCVTWVTCITCVTCITHVTCATLSPVLICHLSYLYELCHLYHLCYLVTWVTCINCVTWVNDNNIMTTMLKHCPVSIRLSSIRCNYLRILNRFTQHINRGHFMADSRPTFHLRCEHLHLWLAQWTMM